jgi:ABC-type Fe3+ transport system permease subunit
LIAGLLFAAFSVIAVANYLLAGIQRLVIITLIDKTRILAIITTIIAPARGGAAAFRIQTFSFLICHLIPLISLIPLFFSAADNVYPPAVMEILLPTRSLLITHLRKSRRFL